MQICIRTNTIFKRGRFLIFYNKQRKVSYRLTAHFKINVFGRNKISDYMYSEGEITSIYIL